jgi:hypothetical protein
VKEPTRRGFGRQVIRQVTVQALAGEVAHEFLSDGVRWTLDIPTAFVVSTRGDPASEVVAPRAEANGRNRHVDR